MANTDSIETDSGGNIAVTTTSSGDTKTLNFPLTLKNDYPEDSEILPDSFRVERQLEGPQILIEWGNIELASEVSSIVIVRRTGRYPRNIDDGEMIFSGNPESGFYNDLDAEPDTYYFYKLFSKRKLDNTFISNDDAKGFDITYKSGYFNDRLYQLLPDTFRLADKDNAEKKSLFGQLNEVVDDEKLDIINHIEEGQAEPQLQRFMKVFARQLDQIKELIDQLKVVTNINRTGPRAVKEMSKLFGINLNPNLTLEQQRRNIKRGVEKIKNKGTNQGIGDDSSSTIGLPSESITGSSWLLMSNSVNSTSFDVDRVDKMNKRQVDNEADFSWGGLTDSLDYNSILIFIEINDDSNLTKDKIERLDKSLQENALALNYELFVTTNDSDVVETSDSFDDDQTS